MARGRHDRELLEGPVAPVRDAWLPRLRVRPLGRDRRRPSRAQGPDPTADRSLHRARTRGLVAAGRGIRRTRGTSRPADRPVALRMLMALAGVDLALDGPAWLLI